MMFGGQKAGRRIMLAGQKVGRHIMQGHEPFSFVFLCCNVCIYCKYFHIKRRRRRRRRQPQQQQQPKISNLKALGLTAALWMQEPGPDCCSATRKGRPSAGPHPEAAPHPPPPPPATPLHQGTRLHPQQPQGFPRLGRKSQSVTACFVI